MKPIQAKRIRFYCEKDGNEPFTVWLDKLRDSKARQRILARLRRVEQGNYGDYKSLDEGINELRFFLGPGYRVYFGESESTLVVLLCGGDKSSQTKDIELAQHYWREYLEDEKLSNAG